MAAVAAPLSAAAPLVAPPDELALLRDTVRGMFAYNITTLAGHAAGAILIEAIYASSAPRALRLGWGGCFALLWLARALLAWRFSRDEPSDAPGLRERLRIWQVGVLLSGAMWGAGAWLFYEYGDTQQQIALVLIAYTYCVACVPILASQFPQFVVFVLLAFVPAIVRVANSPGDHSVELAVAMAVAMGMTIVLGRNFRNSFASVLRLKLRTEALMVELRAESSAADAARREAETANRAKTQFFTAASHDLRQPLHAMGLFAEALRQRTHDPQVAQLVNSINESVDALEGLFSELLDITRIDSGGIEVHPQHFEAGDIFRKIRLHFEPSAFEKGLALRLRGDARVLHADPLLVERIVRNLVSNAIRYTNDGSVLVSCRPRGERMLLQVWDTGLGISAAEQARVFDEFYQVPNTPKVTPEQRKGLGLGLAIVRRLADLMQAPLTLRSTPGRGTVFTLTLPAGKAPRPSALGAPGKAPAGITLAGRRIVIVEDEPAVRAGLEVLLAGWGAHIDAFDSVGASREWAERSDPAALRPDLLIVDYRLEEGRNGVDAIKALRARFGAGIPAILVTGSTMTGHDREAAEHNFHLLIKPVVPNKLRAMIAFKLGVGREAKGEGPR
ncbi:MAG TPA: ATP-binding protein [Burkholderiaceae bacterium]|nr:ATP-binding protein [Burkholderiaceae bacterium]